MGLTGMTNFRLRRSLLEGKAKEAREAFTGYQPAPRVASVGGGHPDPAKHRWASFPATNDYDAVHVAVAEDSESNGAAGSLFVLRDEVGGRCWADFDGCAVRSMGDVITVKHTRSVCITANGQSLLVPTAS
jgi:hypothetical protein